MTLIDFPKKRHAYFHHLFPCTSAGKMVAYPLDQSKVSDTNDLKQCLIIPAFNN